jgi:hypothetical protein
MANIQHLTMPSALVHEPKHITNTTASDIGKVITPVGDGTSILRRLTADEAGVARTYGESAVNANSTAFAITIATDLTLYSVSDYNILTPTLLPTMYGDQQDGVVFSAVDNSLTPSVTGVYRVSFWINIRSDVTSTVVGIKARKNGVWADFTIKNVVQTSGSVQNISGHILTDVTAGNPVVLAVASNKSADITIEDLRFDLELIKEL